MAAPNPATKALRRADRRAPAWELAAGLIGAVLFAGALSGQNPQEKLASPPAPSPPAGTARASQKQTKPSEPQAKPPEPSKPIRVRVERVNVPVSVLDRHGLPVIDLKKEDFQVLEDGVPQSIEYFYRGTRPPLRIGLILDTSNSARSKLSFEQDAASEFVFNMLPGQNSQNRIFLQTFDATSSIVLDFTNDPEILNEKIRALKAAGGKALYDAIYFACREKMMPLGEPAETRRVLVIVSDGLDVQSERTLEEALSMAHLSDTALYVIGNTAWGYDNPGDKVLRTMADDTGGASFFPQEQAPGADLGTGYLSHGQIGDTSQNKGLGAETGKFSAERLIHLADSLDAIGRELNEQYSLQYRPKNDRLDGTYRTIKVVTLRKGVIVRAKPGYFANAQ